MTASYNGTIKVEEADEATHTATLKAKGTDKRGQGGAQRDDRQHADRARRRDGVDAVTDFNITGRLAQFGRGGIMEDVSNRLMRDFATCLSQRLGEGTPAAAAPEPEAPSGAEVTAGDAPPEAVAAARRLPRHRPRLPASLPRRSRASRCSSR